MLDRPGKGTRRAARRAEAAERVRLLEQAGPVTAMEALSTGPACDIIALTPRPPTTRNPSQLLGFSPRFAGNVGLDRKAAGGGAPQ